MELVHRKFDLLVSSVTVYSRLYCMERKGLVQGYYDAGKRIYDLTDKGRKVIKAMVESREQVQGFIENLINEAKLRLS